MFRKLILLGGNAGSPELRDWASLELRGYAQDAELPSYRRVGPNVLDSSHDDAIDDAYFAKYGRGAP